MGERKDPDFFFLASGKSVSVNFPFVIITQKLKHVIATVFPWYAVVIHLFQQTQNNYS